MATLVEIDLEDGGTAIAFLGRIYKISAPGFDKCYVGSTKRELNVRMSDHRRKKRQYDKGRLDYFTSFEVLACEGATIELLEEDAYLDMQHMRDREAFWIGRLDTVNKTTPGRSQKESCRICHARPKECPNCGRHVRIDGMKDHRKSKRCVQTKNKPISSS
jgi:hypothetical protein